MNQKIKKLQCPLKPKIKHSRIFLLVCICIFCSPLLIAQYSPIDSVKSKNLNHIFFISNPKKAFFCRMEDKLIQKSKINFCFRLGSKEYTNYFEYSPYLTKK
jgi:hypothetical protein